MSFIVAEVPAVLWCYHCCCWSDMDHFYVLHLQLN